MNRSDLGRITAYFLFVAVLFSLAYFIGFVSYLVEKFSALPVLDFSQTVYNYASIIAIIVGATWGYSIFVKNREQTSRVEIEHYVSHFSYSKNTNILHIEIRVTNIGKVLIKVSELEASIFQLFPIPKKVRALLRKEYGRKKTSINTSVRELPWEKIAFHAGNFKNDGAEIEPGENQEFLFDFVIDRKISAVSIYSFLHGPPNSESGWEKSSNYYLEGPHRISERKKIFLGKRGLVNRVAETKKNSENRR